ncbi:MAG: Ribosomal protein S12 methylthiotransferase RimO [Phycisphaerae bacterium]|nr:Ribosomal protein S12 methylthiotransferase RimO [Phycisphaerae bacterium]
MNEQLSSPPKRVAFISLGCAKNLVDSERMLGQLAEGGLAITADADDADVIVVNTCGFLEASRQEAHAALAEALQHKQTGRVRRVVAAGCLVQRDGTKLLSDVPGVDALVGVNNREDLLKAVCDETTDKPAGRATPDLYIAPYYWRQDNDRTRLRLTPRHYAYLRISEGCDQKCTFCTIPSIRGPMHCKSPEQILAEARELIADGVVELNLIGQDTTSYGRDINYSAGLAGLLRELNQLDGLRWIRLMYVYPSDFTEEMIAAIAECERVVKYIDMPLQHINERILKAMHRRVTKQQTIDLLQRIRRMIPQVTMRTTMIVGFPGESEAEFGELQQFIGEYEFDALGVFTYSQEADTPAGRMKEQPDQAVKEQRREALMLTQQEIAFRCARQSTGHTLEVMVDRRLGGVQWQGRHAGQAPEVDSVTLIHSRRPLTNGQIVRVRCTGSQDYDLLAQPVDVMLPVIS